MLNRGNLFIFILVYFQACVQKTPLDENYLRSTNIVSKTVYQNVLTFLEDTLEVWQTDRINPYYEDTSMSKTILDTLICFNNDGTRLITTLLGRTFLKSNPTGGISVFCGEKINSRWFFFTGPHIFIPFEMKQDKSNKPFEFSELHQIALKEVYSGYLKPNGEINEEWFTSQFEGPGWGIPDYSQAKTKQDSLQIKDWYFKVAHARQNLRVWNAKRSVCSLYSEKDLDLNYLPLTHQLKITLPVKSYESEFMYNDYFSYSYSVDSSQVKLFEYKKLNKSDTSLNFSIKNIPPSCHLDLMIYLSEVGPLNFTLYFEKGKITKLYFKECSQKPAA